MTGGLQVGGRVQRTRVEVDVGVDVVAGTGRAMVRMALGVGWSWGGCVWRAEDGVRGRLPVTVLTEEEEDMVEREMRMWEARRKKPSPPI